MDPFARIKLELAAVVLLDVCIFLLFAGWDLPVWREFAVLLLIGVASAGWLIWRTRTLGRRLRTQEENENAEG